MDMGVGTSMRRATGMALLCAWVAACAGAPRPDAREAADGPAVPVQILPLEARHEVPAGTVVMQVRNPHGDLRVRITDQAQVGYYAMVQRIGAQPLDPIFDWKQRDGRLLLTVRYPGEEQWEPADGHRHGRVDLAIFIPAALALDLGTTDGFLQVRKARAAVRARTEAGSMEVSGAADLDLRSDSGAIAASQNSGQWQTAVEIHSDSGRIALAVPVYADIALDAETGGRIDLEPGFPGAVVPTDQGSRLQAKFGRALREITVRSQTGEIFIRPGISESVLQVPEKSFE